MKVPFVLEIRDLWPESIVAVGAVKRNAVIRVFEGIEKFLYKRADHIIALTNAFKKFIVGKGIEPNKISVLKNGADLDKWTEPLDEDKLKEFRQKHDLEGKFVASYIGTIGMAHRADVMLEAAQLCHDKDIVFMVVGTGAERAKIEARFKELGLENFRLLGKVPRSEVRYLLALTNVSVVHLKASPLFKTVIPSKIFEAMATSTPIVLGVEGEVKEIIEEAECGIPVKPENAQELVDAVVRLKRNPEEYTQKARNGYQHVHEYYSRAKLAKRYTELLEHIAKGGEFDPEILLEKSAA